MDDDGPAVAQISLLQVGQIFQMELGSRNDERVTMQRWEDAEHKVESSRVTGPGRKRFNLLCQNLRAAKFIIMFAL